MKWISMKDELPLELQEIIIFDKDKRMFLGRYKCNVFEAYGNGCGCCEEDISPEEIRYWMPIPKEPNEMD